MSVDPRRLIVWIGDLETSAAGVNRLCTPCADDLRAPTGWERRDIREAPRLFAVAPTTAPAAPATPAAPAATTLPASSPRARTRRAAARNDAPLPVAATLLELPSEEQSEPWRAEPRSDQLNPTEQTPLLARAFRGVRAAG